MKKATRLIALLAALALMCLSVTGCNALDDMRARHGVFTENGTIKIGNAEYIRLPENEYFTPTNGDEDNVYITTDDVPVLLSVLLGEGYHISGDRLFVWTFLYGESNYYCRADKHAEIAAQLEGEFNPTDYCYTYSFFNPKTEVYESRDYQLTEEQKNAVKHILATVEGKVRDENAHYYYDHCVSLEACTSNMLLRDWRYDIEVYNGTYYLVTKNNGLAYTVPEAYNEVFGSILAPMLEAEKAEKEYFGDYYDDFYDEDIDYDDFYDDEDIDYDDMLLI